MELELVWIITVTEKASGATWVEAVYDDEVKAEDALSAIEEDLQRGEEATLSCHRVFT